MNQPTDSNGQPLAVGDFVVMHNMDNELGVIRSISLAYNAPGEYTGDYSIIVQLGNSYRHVGSLPAHLSKIDPPEATAQ